MPNTSRGGEIDCSFLSAHDTQALQRWNCRRCGDPQPESRTLRAFATRESSARNRPRKCETRSAMKFPMIVPACGVSLLKETIKRKAAK